MPETRLVLGLPVHAVIEDEVIAFVDRHAAARDPVQIVTINAEIAVRAWEDEAYAQTLRRAHLATADGAAVVWAMRRLGVSVPRVGGSDLIWSVSELAAGRGHRVFLLGGRPGVAAMAALRLRERFPGLEVAGTYAGSSRPEEEGVIVDLVRRSRADILFVAFGAPQQERWIQRNQPATGVSVAMGVGGSFDYLAGTARRAPMWMRKRGLEWLWRLIRQPWRWRRMLALPRFVWLVAAGGRPGEKG